MDGSNSRVNQGQEQNKEVKGIFLVLAASFLLIFGTFVSGTILTPYAISLKASWFQVGILSGGMYVVRLIFGTPIGKLADRKGTLTMLKYSLMLYPLIALAYYLAHDITMLIMARFLHGVASAMMIPMGMAYIGQIAPLGVEGRWMAIYNFIVVLASSLGALVSTFVAQRFGFQAPFLVLFILAGIALGVIHGIRPNPERPKNEIAPTAPGATDMVFYQDRGILALVAGNLALAIVASMMGFFILPQLSNLGVDLRYSGALLGLYYGLSGLVQIPAARYLDDANKANWAAGSGLVVAITLLLFTWGDNFLILALMMGIIALANGVLQTALASLAVTRGRVKGMGRTMGFLNTANSAGMFGGCVILGMMPDASGNYGLLFIFTGVAIGAMAIAFMLLWPSGS